MSARIYSWLHALMMSTHKEPRRSFLRKYSSVYASRRSRRNRGMPIEQHIAKELNYFIHMKQYGYVWRNDFFFEPTFADNNTKPPMMFKRRKRKHMNTYQVRRMIAEHILPTQ